MLLRETAGHAEIGDAEDREEDADQDCTGGTLPVFLRADRGVIGVDDHRGGLAARTTARQDPDDVEGVEGGDQRNHRHGDDQLLRGPERALTRPGFSRGARRRPTRCRRGRGRTNRPGLRGPGFVSCSWGPTGPPPAAAGVPGGAASRTPSRWA